MTPLVFLHGVGGGHGAWDDQLAFFSARGYRAIAWDQPGYGSTSALEPYDLERIADAAQQTIQREAGAPAVVVGHSMGGFIAQELYARHAESVRALVLCFTSASFGGSNSDFAREFISARIAPLDAGRSMGDIAAAVMPTMRAARSQPEGLARAERLMAAVPPQTYRKAVALLTTFDRRALLPKIRVPTLLIAGSDDKTAPASIMQRMAARIPGAEFVLLEHCGHLGPMDQPEAFNAALLDFLQRHSL